MPTISIDFIVKTISYAQVFNTKKWKRGLMSQQELGDLMTAIEAFFERLQLEKIDYLVVGGIAMLAYIDGRNTQDLDLIMSQAELVKIAGLEVIDLNKDFARATFNQLQVDVLLSENSLFKRVKQEYSSTTQIDEISIPCVSPEGIVILKLYALPSLYRQGKIERADLYENDILQLTRKYQLDLDKALKVVNPHVIASDREGIKDITSEIQQKIGKSRKFDGER
jgi:hypothetical protein